MATIAALRREYHEMLCRDLLAYYPNSNVPNIVDRATLSGADVGRHLSRVLGFQLAKASAPRQSIHCRFAELTEKFLRRSLSAMGHRMPGGWIVSAKGMLGTADLFGVSRDLTELQEALVRDPQLWDALDGCGAITPDIIVSRRTGADEVISSAGESAARDEQVARFALLRERRQQRPILHASISCKWTMRSDKGQDIRIETLNLVRDCKGNALRILVVTFEPLPNCLASIAMGADGVDCAYHVALPELVQAVADVGNEAYIEQLQELVDGRRLRDISDLPLDLAV
jgi:hypothetical protein